MPRLYCNSSKRFSVTCPSAAAGSTRSPSLLGSPSGRCHAGSVRARHLVRASTRTTPTSLDACAPPTRSTRSPTPGCRARAGRHLPSTTPPACTLRTRPGERPRVDARSAVRFRCGERARHLGGQVRRPLRRMRHAVGKGRTGCLGSRNTNHAMSPMCGPPSPRTGRRSAARTNPSPARRRDPGRVSTT